MHRDATDVDALIATDVDALIEAGGGGRTNRFYNHTGLGGAKK